MKPACPAAKEIAAGASPANSDGERQQRTTARSWSVPTADDEHAADDEAGDGAEQRAQRVLAGAQGVRAQHGERAEDDPERVLRRR